MLISTMINDKPWQDDDRVSYMERLYHDRPFSLVVKDSAVTEKAL